jgi:hypothetical protein
LRQLIAYFDHRGRRIARSARTTDRATAKRIAAKLAADAALRRDGVVDPTLDAIRRESRRSIESHLATYGVKLRAANCTEDHVRRTLKFIRLIAESAGYDVAADISADGVNQVAAARTAWRQDAANGLPEALIARRIPSLPREQSTAPFPTRVSADRGRPDRFPHRRDYRRCPC